MFRRFLFPEKSRNLTFNSQKNGRFAKLFTSDLPKKFFVAKEALRVGTTCDKACLSANKWLWSYKLDVTVDISLWWIRLERVFASNLSLSVKHPSEIVTFLKNCPSGLAQATLAFFSYSPKSLDKLMIDPFFLVMIENIKIPECNHLVLNLNQFTMVSSWRLTQNRIPEFAEMFSSCAQDIRVQDKKIAKRGWQGTGAIYIAICTNLSYINKMYQGEKNVQPFDEGWMPNAQFPNNPSFKREIQTLRMKGISCSYGLLLSAAVIAEISLEAGRASLIL